MEFLLAELQLRIFFQLILAILLGGLIGLEREFKRREAGLRTYALVSLGSALFAIVGLEVFRNFEGIEGVSIDPTRVVQAVAIGIGFIGAGIIIYRHFHVEGLTTAAGLWTAGAIGLAVGFQFYLSAIFATLLVILILSGFYAFEKRFLRKP
jgi:putative Mg2+ transporter-C (MgtC) family protein